MTTTIPTLDQYEAMSHEERDALSWEVRSAVWDALNVAVAETLAETDRLLERSANAEAFGMAVSDEAIEDFAEMFMGSGAF